MRFSLVACVASIMALQVSAVPTDASSNFANIARGFAGPKDASAGRPCTGKVNQVEMQGTCVGADSRCGIDIPPNEFNQVTSADCKV